MDNGDIKICLNQGATSRFTGNSLAAIDYSWSCGCTPKVEVQMTKDKKPVLAENDSIKDICQDSPDLNISESTYKQLMKHPLCTGDGIKHSIPLVESIFEQMRVGKARTIMLDVKNDSAYGQIFDLVKQYDIARQVQFITPMVKKARAIKKVLFESRVFLSVRKFSKQTLNDIKSPDIDSILYEPRNGLTDEAMIYPDELGITHVCDIAKKAGKKVGLVMLDEKIDPNVIKKLKKVGVSFFVVSNPLKDH